MKTKILFMLLMFVSITLFAQTETITIDWSFNSTPSALGNANASRTIEVGDTVEWNWFASGSHNVVSSTGSAESFNSGEPTSNPGINFSYTFKEIGSNPYVCSPHSSNMFGTITVVADGTLGVNTFEERLNLIKVYPNPVSTTINIDFPSDLGQELKVEFYNVLGKKIFQKDITTLTSEIPISNWNNGVYFMKIYSDLKGESITKRFIKI